MHSYAQKEPYKRAMLDLTLLERQLDAALEKETAASLTDWLLYRRISNFLSTIGSDQVLDTPPEAYKTDSITINSDIKTFSKTYTLDGDVGDFLFAA